MKMTTRPSVLADVSYIAYHLRPADVAELKASSGNDPLASISHGFEKSDNCTTIINEEGTPIGIGGVIPADGYGVVWMVATPGIEECGTSLLRQSRPFMDKLQENYPILFNFIDDRNDLHKKWVKWVGFEFVKTIENYGNEQRKFHAIVRRRIDV